MEEAHAGLTADPSAIAAAGCAACHDEPWSARSACAGCHDSDAAASHMKNQTYDPTPLAPWSGDEGETCKVCH